MFFCNTLNSSSSITLINNSEDALHELVPSIDKTAARRLASNFASSREFKALDASEGLKVRIKKVAKKFLDNVERRRRRRRQKASKAAAEALLSLHGSPKQRVPRYPKDRKKYHVLKHVVGEEKFNEILSVYKEIKYVRQHSKIWTKYTPQFMISTSTTPTESSTSSLSSYTKKRKMPTRDSSDDYGRLLEEEKSSILDNSEMEDEPLSVSQVLPSPIANIYFHVRLVDVMRAIDAGSCCRFCKPIEELSTEEEKSKQRTGCIVYQNDWDDLLHDAKKKLAAFRKFQRDFNVY